MTASEVEESRRRWDSVAVGWARQRDRFAETVAPVTDALLALLEPRAGERILELAAGPGDLGLRVAQRVGDTGSVLVTDFAPEMVAASRSRAAELGLANVETAVVDGQAIGLPSGSFDGVVCRFGYMLMPEPVHGFAETRRVLCEGGRVAFAVWGDRRLNSWGTAATRALVDLGYLEGVEPYAPGPFALDEPERLLAALDGGRLELDRVEDVAVVWRFSSPGAWWEMMCDLSSHLTETLDDLADDAIEALRDRAASYLVTHKEGDGIAIDGVARVLLARPAP
jgi:SAM-dependent methyltransferase